MLRISLAFTLLKLIRYTFVPVIRTNFDPAREKVQLCICAGLKLYRCNVNALIRINFDAYPQRGDLFVATGLHQNVLCRICGGLIQFYSTIRKKSSAMNPNLKQKLISTVLIVLSQLIAALMPIAQLASIVDRIHRRRRRGFMSLLDVIARVERIGRQPTRKES